MNHRVDRLTLKLALGTIFLVLLCLSIALYLIITHYYQRQLANISEWAFTQSSLVGRSLEDQMLDRNPRLIKKMIHNFSDEPTLDRVLILDRQGLVRHSSDPALEDHRYALDSPTCVGCHQPSATKSLLPIMLYTEDGQVLRTVRPMENKPVCHDCHDPANRINGMVIVDVSVARLKDRLVADIRWMVLGSGLLAVVLMGGIRILVRRQVLSRLRRFEFATRSISQGDFHQRVPEEGNDALHRLAVDFNAMAESLEQLLSQLRFQQRQLENIMNSVDDGLLVLDRERNIVAVNDSFARRFRIDGTRLLEKSCCTIPGMPEECGSESGGEIRDCPAMQCFEKAKDQWAMRRISKEDGGERIEEVRVSPVFDENGEVHQVVEVWRDITERRSAEAQMAEFQRLASLGMFASGFSHEVNTPLASALTCVDGILRSASAIGDSVEAPWPEVLEWANIIRNEILRCKQITQQILQLSRGEKLVRQIITIPDMMESVLPLVRERAKEANVSIALNLNGDMPPVVANRAALQQVLINLISNAIQACRSGGRISIGCSEDACARLCIEDDGSGIPHEILNRIFEPFFSTSFSGTGLGLFVSKNLARNWGGDIEVSSTPGIGARFDIIFPLNRES